MITYGGTLELNFCHYHHGTKKEHAPRRALCNQRVSFAAAQSMVCTLSERRRSTQLILLGNR